MTPPTAINGLTFLRVALRTLYALHHVIFSSGEVLLEYVPTVDAFEFVVRHDHSSNVAKINVAVGLQESIGI
ncbi:MAG: hypothetical protein V3U69_03135 [Bacteroidota bacterium]